jgi:hypothetical protein
MGNPPIEAFLQDSKKAELAPGPQYLQLLKHFYYPV